jgi:DNA-binding response OmpR family regulator
VPTSIAQRIIAAPVRVAQSRAEFDKPMISPTEGVTGLPPGAERRAAGQALRIVVADDNRDAVDTLAAILRQAGHTVYCVYNGSDVLPTVRFVRPDAAILDIAIPGMSGYAVAQEIRYSFTDLRRPLLIAISGMWKSNADKLIARQVGFDHYLDKPCAADELLKLLEPLRQKHPAV